MKKSIATLCALAACSAAHAQSNVTLYGDVDEYIGYIHSNSGKSITGLNDGTMLRSRFGFKGMEDLGNGLQAKFQLESGINADTGTLGDAPSATSSGRLFDRQAWVGIAGTFGEFRVGRQNTEIQQIGDYIDYTGRTTFGSVVNNVPVPSRYDNDLSFKTNRMSGFQGAVHYALAEQAGGGIQRSAIYQLWLDYNNGPYRVGYVGLGAKPLPAVATNPATHYDNKAQFHNVYADYDYGQGKVYLAYVRTNLVTSSSAGASAGQILGNTAGYNTTAGAATNGNLFSGYDANILRFVNVYQISADYRITPQMRVGALYGQVVDKNHAATANHAGAKGGNIGAIYDLSKRTTLYSFANYLKNDTDAGYRFGGSGAVSANLSGTDVNNRKLIGLQAGIIHRF